MFPAARMAGYGPSPGGFGHIRSLGDLEAWIRERFPQLVRDRLARLAGIDFGSATATFTASVDSANMTVPHALGVAPSAVFFSAKTPRNVRVVIQERATADEDNIYALASQAAGVAVTNTQDFYWLAVV